MRTIMFLVRKEYLHVARDRATMIQVLLIPVIQLLILANAATFSVRETPLHLVDLDGTRVSRQLVSRFEASPYFRVVGTSPTVARAGDALLAGDATLVLHIPSGFEADLVRLRTAPIQLVLNAEQGAAAGIVRSYATRIIADYGADLGSELAPDARAIGDTPAPRPGSARIDLRSRGWYNPGLDYRDYMVPGILVALITIMGTLLTAQNITREKEHGTLEQLNVTPISRPQFIAGKLVPFWILGMAELAVGLLLARLVFDIPMRGSVLLIFGVAAIYLVAALGLGLLISTVAETQQQAMFVTFFVLLIYLLMSGLFTPITSMPRSIQLLAELNPVKHFVHVMRAVLVKGAGPGAIVAPVLALTAFATVILSLAIRQYSKRTA
jgi:ABC-2 type transport system permease protein